MSPGQYDRSLGGSRGRTGIPGHHRQGLGLADRRGPHSGRRTRDLPVREEVDARAIVVGSRERRTKRAVLARSPTTSSAPCPCWSPAAASGGADEGRRPRRCDAAQLNGGFFGRPEGGYRWRSTKPTAGLVLAGCAGLARRLQQRARISRSDQHHHGQHPPRRRSGSGRPLRALRCGRLRRRDDEDPHHQPASPTSR
jgi:hypothetical protein